MSAKAHDGQGCWRCKTIGVRVSPEENTEIDALAALSGMTKQDYCINRILHRDIVVVGNPRVHKALKTQIAQLCSEFEKVCGVDEIKPETLTVLEYTCRGKLAAKREKSRIIVVRFPIRGQ